MLSNTVAGLGRTVAGMSSGLQYGGLGSLLTLSGGLDALSARRGSVLAGDREFFKGNLLMGCEQAPL
jgi:hypothetical protein